MSDRSPASSTLVDSLVDRVVVVAQSRLVSLRSRLNPEIVTAVALGLVLLISAIVVWSNVRTQWFIYDEFDYLAPPEGSSWLGWLITPHNEHTILFTKLWFSFLFNTVGLQAYGLYAAPMVVAHLAGGVAVYKLMRLIVPSRAVSVAAVAPVMIMAAGAGTLTWAGQFQYTAATTAGLWALYCALSPTLGGRSRWIWIVALSLFGTFSGSAYIPLGVAAGLAAITLRRYLLGIVTILIPSIWFVCARTFWIIPSYNSAHDLAQILRDGPEFIFALLNKAVNDSIPVEASFTAPLLLVSSVGVIAFLASRGPHPGSSRARRTYLFLLVALVLSLVITLVGRLSRDLQESASGGYSYFILIAAIPLFVVTIARFFNGTKIAVTLIVLLLAGWTAINVVSLGDTARGLASWKAGNAALLTGAASLSPQNYPVISDGALPSPDLAPTVTWAELVDAVSEGHLTGSTPSQLTADQLSLNLQWRTETSSGAKGAECSILEPHQNIVLDSTEVRVTPADPGTTATSVTLEYPTSTASRLIQVPTEGNELASVADRNATLTASEVPVTVCE